MIRWHLILNLTHFVKFSFSSMLGWGSSHTFGGATSLIWYESSVTPVIITIPICILDIYVFMYISLLQTVLTVAPQSQKGYHRNKKVQRRATKMLSQKICSTALSVAPVIITATIHILNTYILLSQLSKWGVRSSFSISYLCILFDLAKFSSPYIQQAAIIWSTPEDTEATKMVNVN